MTKAEGVLCKADKFNNKKSNFSILSFLAWLEFLRSLQGERKREREIERGEVKINKMYISINKLCRTLPPCDCQRLS